MSTLWFTSLYTETDQEDGGGERKERGTHHIERKEGREDGRKDGRGGEEDERGRGERQRWVERERK